ELDAKIDNGNHLFLSCNEASLFYLEMIGAARTVNLPKRSVFPFMDVQSGERWKLHVNDGKFPFWIFNPKTRVPGTRPAQYLKDGNNLLRARDDATLDKVLDKNSLLYKRFWAPLAVSILNTQGFEASARLFNHVLQEIFAKGGKGCRPLTVKEGLS